MKPYQFHAEAWQEFEDAANYYEFRQSGLGDEFAAAINDAITHIRQTPELYAKVEGDVRRCLAQRFPYAIMYLAEPDGIYIVAVTHGHRHPDYWKHRL